MSREVVSYFPVWEPLERLSEEDGAVSPGSYMFMGSALASIIGTGCAVEPTRWVHRYKHIDTRRYLNLGDDGACYRWESFTDYRRVPTAAALQHVQS